MRSILLAFFSILLLANPAFTQNYFLSHPQISPDGNTLYFTYDSDIWKYNIRHKKSSRLTNLRGNISALSLSPDGNKLAFSSNKYGQNDVYVLDLQKGQTKQLTYHDASNEVSGWSWDNTTIYFTSNRYNMSRSYAISAQGGTAKALFKNYFNITNQLIEHPNGGYIFTTGMESTGQLSRKRYKGPNNPEIYYLNNNTLENLSQYEGKDLYPSVDKNGIIYYQSDEKNGFNNLMVYKNGKKETLTNFEEDIAMPQVNTEGTKVVFTKNYQLYLFDIESGQIENIQPLLNNFESLQKLQTFNTSTDISYFDVSPDASKLAFISRGQLFVSDIEGKSIKQVGKSGERILEVKWLADNKRLIYNQTDNGYPQWFVLNAFKDEESPKQITKENKSNRNISLNKNRSQAVYLSGRDELRLIDLSSFQSKTLIKDEFWAFGNPTPRFSPNNQYVVYTAFRNFEEDIFALNLENKEVLNLTKTGVTETDPIWSPDGKYIYFTSNRTVPAYPYGLENAHIYQLAIDWFSLPFASDHLEEIFTEKQEEDLDILDKKKKKRKKDKEKRKVAAEKKQRINPDGLRDRIETISSNFGSQNSPFISHLKDKQFIWYNSNEDAGKTKWYVTELENYRKKASKVVHNQSVQQVLEVQDKIYFLSKNKIYNLDQNSLKSKEIALSHSFYKNLREEFNQMFYETWAGVEENFYENDFHGIDWEKARDQYKAYLPYVKDRNELRILLNDMLGELNSSHLGFRSLGKEEKAPISYRSNETGIVFSEKDPFKVASILRKSPAAQKESNVKIGDEVIAINGIKVEAGMNRDSLFSLPELRKEIHLTILRNGVEHKSKIHPISTAKMRDLFYDEWIYENDKYVQEKSDSTIAYVYMKNMSGASLEQFYLDMAAKEQNSKGLILDLRFNTGGNVHDKVLQFLAQRPYLEWQYRNGKRAPQSTFAPSGKPIVLLINEASLSDAEMTAAGFKSLQLGTIVGQGTYRWIIFTSGKSLVDGSMFRIPAWGCYTLDGDNLEKSGVEPDIFIDIDVLDRENGKDPQLDEAIKIIMN